MCVCVCKREIERRCTGDTEGGGGGVGYRATDFGWVKRKLLPDYADTEERTTNPLYNIHKIGIRIIKDCDDNKARERDIQ